MNDRELLELAAKAAGMTLIGSGKWSDGDVWAWNDDGCLFTSKGHEWSPLTDDGDALRLAVKLRMRLQVDDYGAAARISDTGRWHGFEAHMHGGIESATRRAIVRAAADAGEQS